MKRSSAAIIVDVDGTLVDVSSLRHYVLGAQKPDGSYNTKNFDAFHRGSVDCPPIEQTVKLVQQYADSGHAVLIVTARSDKYYPQTAWWLADHKIPHSDLYMRAEGDFRPDYEVKRDIYARIVKKWGTVVHAIDDNPAVIALWEELNIPTTVIPGWVAA